VLLYGSETWTIKARDARRISVAEMNYVRRTAGYTWTDYKLNRQIVYIYTEIKNEKLYYFIINYIILIKLHTAIERSLCTW
jgi:hypothetical protein